MARPVKREPKKPYKKPSLTVYGTIRELTLKTGKLGQLDGGNPRGAKFATHV
jgi:hypothetical protein